MIGRYKKHTPVVDMCTGLLKWPNLFVSTVELLRYLLREVGSEDIDRKVVVRENC